MDDQLSRGKYRVTLKPNERESLMSLVKTDKAAARKLVRVRILLLADEGELGPGKSDTEIAEVLECGVRTVEQVRNKKNLSPWGLRRPSARNRNRPGSRRSKSASQSWSTKSTPRPKRFVWCSAI